MFRITIFVIAGLSSVVAASAGQIQIGGANGLSSAYITNPNTVAGQNTTGCAGGGTCINGSTGAYTEQNYDNVLFAGATSSSVAPTPYVGYSTSSANVGTVTDTTDGITFSMINDGLTSGASNNFWAAPQVCSPTCTSPAITIPIGIFGVTDVWTMLNTELGPQSAKNGAFVFTFGATPNATTGTQSITVKLFDSTASGISGELTNAVNCAPNCSLANGSTLAGPVTNLTAGVSVFTNDGLLNSATSVITYDNGPLTVPGGLGTYAGSSGGLTLSDQGFYFNGISLSGVSAGDTNLNTYLVSVKVQQSGSAANVSDALSAITVETVPEPSTVLLIFSGLGALGLARFRRL